MYLSGLTSISFRSLTCEEIIELARGHVKAIEWGGDVHLAPGDTARARDVAEKSHAAGLLTPSYGSYYKAGIDDNFDAVLESAVALGAETIRIWAGDTASADITEEDRAKITADIIRITRLADEKDISISSEYHRNTLTDNSKSALRLINDVYEAEAFTFFTYWQPGPWNSPQRNKDELAEILPYLTNVHIYNWTSDFKRLPIEDGKTLWSEYFDIIDFVPQNRYVFIEFVRDDDPKNFIADAQAVERIIK